MRVLFVCTYVKETWSQCLSSGPGFLDERPRRDSFPNSHVMGSCKTNRRTGAVGSPSELVGGWCPGHVLMASGSCDAGVPVMF